MRTSLGQLSITDQDLPEADLDLEYQQLAQEKLAGETCTGLGDAGQRWASQAEVRAGEVSDPA